jgi:hypothetical protein
MEDNRLPAVGQLEATPEILRGLMRELTEEDARWKPAADRLTGFVDCEVHFRKCTDRRSLPPAVHFSGSAVVSSPPWSLACTNPQKTCRGCHGAPADLQLTFTPVCRLSGSDLNAFHHAVGFERGVYGGALQEFNQGLCRGHVGCILSNYSGDDGGNL